MNLYSFHDFLFRGSFLVAVKDITDISSLMQQIKQKEFFDFIVYLAEKNGEELKLSNVREKYSNFVGNIDSLQFLIENEFLWIEMDGKVHPGRLTESLYSVVSKMSGMARKE
jgi:hypothetical protein